MLKISYWFFEQHEIGYLLNDFFLTRLRGGIHSTLKPDLVKISNIFQNTCVDVGAVVLIPSVVSSETTLELKNRYCIYLVRSPR